METYKNLNIDSAGVGARARKTLQIPGCQERCRKTLQFPMHFNYCYENVHFLVGKVHISEECDPRTETPHWKRMILQYRFQASRRNWRFSSWKRALYWDRVKMHSKIDSSESLKILWNSSVFFVRNCRIYTHDPHLSEIDTFLARTTRFSEIS